MLPELARGDANEVFVIPSEFAEAFGGITKSFAARATAEGTGAGQTDLGANSKGPLPSGP
ncbi:MAG TPA: hypothetical protein VE571_02760 [Solirubrobacteraceae bacterium]|nr:hypothetical protein [Solirubrobacteraceae bacterium]